MRGGTEEGGRERKERKPRWEEKGGRKEKEKEREKKWRKSREVESG